MKATGIVRRIDELGRVVLPMELRKHFNWNVKDSIEIYVDGDAIILKKYDAACVFCQSKENVVEINNKNVCTSCIKEIKNL